MVSHLDVCSTICVVVRNTLVPTTDFHVLDLGIQAAAVAIMTDEDELKYQNLGTCSHTKDSHSHHRETGSHLHKLCYLTDQQQHS